MTFYTRYGAGFRIAVMGEIDPKELGAKGQTRRNAICTKGDHNLNIQVLSHPQRSPFYTVGELY